MKKLKVIAVAMAAALMIPQANAQDSAADLNLPSKSLSSVLGESLDSGLGDLPATYTAAEYMYPGWVRGESMDSGLGQLPATYTAAEFMPENPHRVLGEKLDSGLGELTRADTIRLGAAARK